MTSVVIVDDQAMVRQGLRLILELAGHARDEPVAREEQHIGRRRRGNQQACADCQG